MARVEVLGPFYGDYFLCGLTGEVSGEVRIKTEQEKAGFCELPGRPRNQDVSLSESSQWTFLKDPESGENFDDSQNEVRCSFKHLDKLFLVGRAKQKGQDCYQWKC